MMNEYCINGLTIKENLLRLAGEGNKKFTESLHTGIENVLGVRVPALRQLPAQIAKDDWQAYLQSADTVWTFVKDCMIDREYGEWYSDCFDGEPKKDTPKVSMWRCPYHTVRLGVEIHNRLK